MINKFLLSILRAELLIAHLLLQIIVNILYYVFLQSRDIDRSKSSKVKEANKYYFIESTIALGVSLVINVFIVAVFAHGMYDKTNVDVVSTVKY